MASRLATLPVKTGWTPSWEHRCSAEGDLLDERDRWAEAVEALVREVSQTPIDACTDVGADTAEGGFTSWRASLADRDDGDLLAELALAERNVREAAARSAALVAEFASRQPGTRWVGGVTRGAGGEFTGDHLALALGVSTRSAERRVHEAADLTRFPKVHAALACGLVGLPGVRAFLAQTAAVTDPGTAAEVETRVLDGVGRPWLPDLGRRSAAEIADLPFPDVAALAGAATPGQITQRTRAAITRLAKDALRPKAVPGTATRCVEVWPSRAGDGMAWLAALLPEAAALAAYQRIDQIAQQRSDAHDPIAQVRADTLLDLLLTQDTHTSSTGTPAPVNVHVLIDAAGAATTPRLGPIAASTVEGLTALAERTGGTVTTTAQTPVTCPGQHPGGGAGHPHDPTIGTTRTLHLRNPVCVFPGCVQPTTGCDLDHTVPWPHGPTCICNLGPLCRHHHRLKTHDPGWSLTNHGNGRYTWTTPHDTTHTVTP